MIQRRNAARTVIWDEKERKIAILEVRGGDYHKIPGGGIDEGESAEKAARREAEEESGCDVQILAQIGESELLDKNVLHHSVCFLCKKIAEVGGPKFTAFEIRRQFRVLWLTFEEAFDRFNAVRSSGQYQIEMNNRDMEFVKKAKEMLGERGLL